MSNPMIFDTGGGIRTRANRVQGLPQVLGSLKKMDATVGKAVEAALLKAGLFLQARSQEVVPVDTGTLRASAFTQLVTREGGRFAPRGFSASVEVGYTVYYATWVHEWVDVPHAAGKIAKYLEVPSRQYAGRMRDIVADHVKRAIVSAGVEKVLRFFGENE